MRQGAPASQRLVQKEPLSGTKIRCGKKSQRKKNRLDTEMHRPVWGDCGHDNQINPGTVAFALRRQARASL